MQVPWLRVPSESHYFSYPAKILSFSKSRFGSNATQLPQQDRIPVCRRVRIYAYKVLFLDFLQALNNLIASSSVKNLVLPFGGAGLSIFSTGLSTGIPHSFRALKNKCHNNACSSRTEYAETVCILVSL